MKLVANVIQTRHVLAVKDLSGEADFYVSKLGFDLDFSVPGWEFLSLGSFKVMLGECVDAMAAYETGDHSYYAHVLVENVDDLFEAFESNGVDFLQEVADRSWGLREFHVRTPSGHRIMFGQEISRPEER